eukprot:scaffold232871_cov76-Cyclotella_meneghiniana.AAC.1
MDKNGEYTTINLMSGHQIAAAIADDDYIAKLEVDERVVWRLPLTFHVGAAMRLEVSGEGVRARQMTRGCICFVLLCILHINQIHGTAVQWDTPEQGLMHEQIWIEGQSRLNV